MSRVQSMARFFHQGLVPLAHRGRRSSFIIVSSLTPARPGHRAAQGKEGRVCMDAIVRRQVATGTGARDFGRSHPVDAPEFVLILGELDELLGLVQVTAAKQLNGFIERHKASVRKDELERQIRGTHLPHIRRAAKGAVADDPQLAQAFPPKPAATNQAEFRTIAGGIADAAEAHKDVMGKRGMSANVLGDLQDSIKQYDAAMELGVQARAARLEASAQLRHLGKEIIKRVRLLDGINRLHFRQDPAALEAWKAVSKVQRGAKAGVEGSEGGAVTEGAAGGDVRPASDG
jgi:hypothetical protein